MVWNTNGFIFMRNHPLNIVISVKKEKKKKEIFQKKTCKYATMYNIRNRTDDIFVGLLTM